MELGVPAAAFLGGVRRSLALSEDGLAAQLRTSRHVVASLEAGAWGMLPPWPETARVIAGWMALAGLDARPALAEAAAHFRARDAVRPPPRMTAEPAPRRAPPAPQQPLALGYRVAPPASAFPAGPEREAPRVLRGALAGRYAPHVGEDEDDDDVGLSLSERIGHRFHSLSGLSSRLARFVAGSRKRRALVLVLVGSSVVLFGGTGTTAVGAAAVSSLPQARNVLVTISDFLAAKLAPAMDGHHSIHAGDPRSRRGDRLPPGP